MRTQSTKIERICPVCGNSFFTTPKYIREGSGKHCSRACAHEAMRMTPERFWSLVDQSGGASACWPWMGHVSKGYPRVRFNGALHQANRVAWMLTHGPIPKRQPVEQTCGNDMCCNPAHLSSYAQDDPERFWRLVDKSGGPDACWEWQGGRDPAGYGYFYLHGKTLHAHRHVYRLLHGHIPSSVFVCHSCDNPPCCNDAHHFTGTSQENTADRHRKGRSKPPHNPSRRPGELAAMAKLTDSAVLAIRAAFAGGKSLTEIAREHDVTPENVSMIVKRKTWQHI